MCIRDSYSGIRGAIMLFIYKALSHSVSEWHSNKVDWFGKNAYFSTLLVAMATSLEKSKKLNKVSKPLHLSTNSEILVKIALLVSQLRWLESRPLKKNKKIKEKTSVKYIALPASLPSGLN